MQLCSMDFHFHHIRDLPRIRHISLTTTKSTGLVTNWLDYCNSLQYTKELSRLYCVYTAFQRLNVLYSRHLHILYLNSYTDFQVSIASNKTIHSKIACSCNASTALLGTASIPSQFNSGHLPIATLLSPHN